MKQAATEFSVRTRGRGLHEFTRDVGSWVERQGITTGLVTLFCRHTSASLLIQENADPDVRADLDGYFNRLAPDGDALYEHTMEGPDDMSAHVRTALTPVSLGIPVLNGRLVLGTWQGIYLWEHRDHSHSRQVVAHLIGE
jgi:secondary thiamine-phosphate synthase enzyme